MATKLRLRAKQWPKTWGQVPFRRFLELTQRRSDLTTRSALADAIVTWQVLGGIADADLALMPPGAVHNAQRYVLRLGRVPKYELPKVVRLDNGQPYAPEVDCTHWSALQWMHAEQLTTTLTAATDLQPALLALALGRKTANGVEAYSPARLQNDVYTQDLPLRIALPITNALTDSINYVRGMFPRIYKSKDDQGPSGQGLNEIGAQNAFNEEFSVMRQLMYYLCEPNILANIKATESANVLDFLEAANYKLAKQAAEDAVAKMSQ